MLVRDEPLLHREHLVDQCLFLGLQRIKVAHERLPQGVWVESGRRI
jgi:hypothetical protein